VAGLDRRRRTKVKIKIIAAALLMLTAAPWSTAIAGDAVSSAVLRSLPNDGEYCGEKKATATFPQELRGEWCHQTDEGDCAASPGKISSGMRVELKGLRLGSMANPMPRARSTRCIDAEIRSGRSTSNATTLMERRRGCDRSGPSMVQDW
jgi:hypothetical protein